METYECEELKSSDATTMAADAESIALIEQLGLEGQKSLTNQETLTREPYREMTALEFYIWRSVCPETTKLQSYSLSPIPLRVLQVAAYAKELGVYQRLEVWHPRKVVDDPLLVGLKHGNEYTSKRDLIARWGETLIPFETLIEQAKKNFTVELTAAIQEIESELARVKSSIANRVEMSFSKCDFNLPCAYHMAKP